MSGAIERFRTRILEYETSCGSYPTHCVVSAMNYAALHREVGYGPSEILSLFGVRIDLSIYLDGDAFCFTRNAEEFRGNATHPGLAQTPAQGLRPYQEEINRVSESLLRADAPYVYEYTSPTQPFEDLPRFHEILRERCGQDLRERLGVVGVDGPARTAAGEALRALENSWQRTREGWGVFRETNREPGREPMVKLHLKKRDGWSKIQDGGGVAYSSELIVAEQLPTNARFDSIPPPDSEQFRRVIFRLKKKSTTETYGPGGMRERIDYFYEEA